MRRADGGALPSEGTRRADPCRPASDGPAFLVTKNFDAIYAYNAAESYALAIAHLSDRLRGGGPSPRRGRRTIRGLSRAERRELQAMLLKRGYDIGAPDGAIGTKTRQAIADVQGKLGRNATAAPPATCSTRSAPGSEVGGALRKGLLAQTPLSHAGDSL